VTEQDERDIPRSDDEVAAEAQAPEVPGAEQVAPEDVPPEKAPPEPETVEAQPSDEATPQEEVAAVEQPEEATTEQPEQATAEQPEEATGGPPSLTAEESPAPGPAPRSPAELAADARYTATGKRKSSVARVILMPGTGEFRLNGRPLEVYFPRRTHQVVVQQPLETAGYVGAVDVVARIHGGGISGQADAVRHGIAKALISADPALRGELKRRQLLTRDPRVKERRKAGLKKARKRPQFSKR
jgi:small subunit ribosomal protein S9